MDNLQIKFGGHYLCKRCGQRHGTSLTDCRVNASSVIPPEEVWIDSIDIEDVALDGYCSTAHVFSNDEKDIDKKTSLGIKYIRADYLDSIKKEAEFREVNGKRYSEEFKWEEYRKFWKRSWGMDERWKTTIPDAALVRHDWNLIECFVREALKRHCDKMDAYNQTISNAGLHGLDSEQIIELHGAEPSLPNILNELLTEACTV